METKKLSIHFSELGGEFLPYLWGMETAWHMGPSLQYRLRSYRTYEEWKPMIMAVWIRRFGVLTVPMRNGNLVRVSIDVLTDVSSYRTYEEWKPDKPIPLDSKSTSSYRTYEEWKLIVIFWITHTKIRSYRTYEEWKQNGYCDVESLWILFLPYLWGMETF